MIDIPSLKLDCYDIVGVLHTVHQELGPGLNEYVYQEGLEMELSANKFVYRREATFHPMYRGVEMSAEYRLDFLCEEKIIVECKSVQKLIPEHRAQLFNYMRLTRMPIGILVNFSPTYAEVERYFYDADEQIVYDSDGVELTKLYRK